MKKTIEVIVGEKPTGEVDPKKVGSSSTLAPKQDEVSGHYPVVYNFECWNDGALCRAIGDTDYWTYVRCCNCGAINKI